MKKIKKKLYKTIPLKNKKVKKFQNKTKKKKPKNKQKY